MDPSPASISFRRRNHLGGTRIGATEQLQVSDDEQNNDDGTGEANDHMYEIPRRNRGSE